jgi:hypothetical protein
MWKCYLCLDIRLYYYIITRFHRLWSACQGGRCERSEPWVFIERYYSHKPKITILVYGCASTSIPNYSPELIFGITIGYTKANLMIIDLYWSAYWRERVRANAPKGITRAMVLNMNIYTRPWEKPECNWDGAILIAQLWFLRLSKEKK